MIMCTIPNSNIQGFTHAIQTLLKNPEQFLPHLTIPTFAQLPEQLGPHLQRQQKSPPPSSTPSTSTSTKNQTPPISITALVLDKDNTLCPQKTTTIPPKILRKLTSLRTSPASPFNAQKNPNGILIVSNRAGSHPAYDYEVQSIESQLSSSSSSSSSPNLNLRIPVFRLPEGARKKPFCGDEVLSWFRERGVIRHAGEVAVVGDRLGTDVVMAAEMGAWSVWCSEGVWGGEEGRRRRGLLERMEVWVERYLRVNRGLRAPVPKGFHGKY